MSAIEAVIVRVLQSVRLGRVAVRLSGDLRRRLYHCGMAVAGQSIPYLPSAADYSAANGVLDFASLHPNGRSLAILLLLFFILPVRLVLTIYDRVQACRRVGAIGLMPSSIRMLGPLIAMVGAFFFRWAYPQCRPWLSSALDCSRSRHSSCFSHWSLILLVLFRVICAAVKHGLVIRRPHDAAPVALPAVTQRSGPGATPVRTHRRAPRKSHRTSPGT
jgi:hypothetical protein